MRSEDKDAGKEAEGRRLLAMRSSPLMAEERDMIDGRGDRHIDPCGAWR
jgi:hypothetical protein